MFVHSDDELPHEGEELSKEAKLDKVKKVETSIKFTRNLKPSTSKGKKSYSSPSPAFSNSYKRQPSYRDEGRRPDYRKGGDRRVPEHRSLADKSKGKCYFCDKSGHQAKTCPALLSKGFCTNLYILCLLV